jgi:DNA integrity scanning protein DisA with diadenylate cyclase activity
MNWLENLLRALTDIRLTDCLDIAIVTLVLYAFLVALKRTRRSGLIFTGIVILGIIYLVARKFNLLLTVALLQGFFAVILVALIVIFQEDLRYFFERVGLWWRERSLPLYKRHARRLPRREVEILARTLGDLARAKIGALAVVRGHDMIARHLEGGEEVQGRLSEPLLKSIFDPHSLGHDGVVAGQGGNAGAQSLAIVMRGLVMREIPKNKVKQLIMKEGFLGMISGTVTGVVTALVAWLWHGNPWLGLVIGLAMVVNLFAAGLAGAAIPVVMKAMGLDPAQCSSIIQTTVTDVVGFFAFLGFAVVFQSHLM